MAENQKKERDFPPPSLYLPAAGRGGGKIVDRGRETRSRQEAYRNDERERGTRFGGLNAIMTAVFFHSCSPWRQRAMVWRRPDA